MSAGSITWVEALEQRVRNVLAADDLDGLRMLLANRHPADIAEVIDRLDDEDKIRLFRLLPPRQAADVLGETSADATRELLEHLPAEEVGDLLDSLPMDDVAEILTEDVPSNLNCEPISPATITGNSTATISCQPTAASTYPVTIIGRSGSLVRTSTFVITAVDFSLSASPASVSLNVNDTRASTITVAALNGFGGNVTIDSSNPDRKSVV